MLVTLEVGRVAHGGHFIAHSHGMTIFVRGAITGEQVKARITQVKKRIAMAETVEVIQKSTHRVEPPCHYFKEGACGGCDFQHIDLEYQRELKAQVVIDSFRRIAGVDIQVKCLPASEQEDGFHWRTRMDFTLSPSGKVALHPYRSDALVEIVNCKIAETAFVTEEINTHVAKSRLPAFERVRVATDASGELVLSGQVEMQVLGKEFPVSLASFWQPHRKAAQVLVARLMDLLEVREGERILDLYGGVGLFTAFIRDRVGDTGRVSLIESDRSSIHDARSKFKGDRRVQVIEARVEDAIGKIEGCDRIVVDPPRSGLGSTVIRGVVRLAPQQIVYISCDPATLARDSKELIEAGYRLESIEAFDLFPMTEHIESVANFIRPSS